LAEIYAQKAFLENTVFDTGRIFWASNTGRIFSLFAQCERTYEMLALNSRIDIEQEAAVLFSSWGALESKAISLRRSGLPVVMFKCDGDAWYKQFRRRLQQVAEGVASWPRALQADKPKSTAMSLFYDTRLQFGDACTAHRTYRVSYMLIWMLLGDAADRRASNPKVRECGNVYSWIWSRTASSQKLI
jgi:hypothetical protein